jgi:hypothetical protein
MNNNWVGFNIFAVFDFENQIFLSNIDELASLELEDLEPL